MTDLRPLEWFPKRFGAGDMAGQGAQRLLGQPDLSTWELLVRETAQNSWDARDIGTIPSYGIHLRAISGGTLAALRTLFAGGSAELGLEDVLSRDTMRVVEINDRGTRGLGGPIRNDLATDAQTRTDFADFVLTLGAPRDTEFGGGTYGFGKTASYTASSCGTVVIWSRTRHEGELQHRFIASAFGPTFEIGNHRYTGRHWWGTRIDNNVVEPLVGDEAQQWGETLFSNGFAGNETGTSLLILAPVMPDDPGTDSPEDALVAAWRAAVVRNLWPKFIPDQPSARTMHIEILRDGFPMQLITPDDEALFQAQGQALSTVRRAQAGVPATPTGGGPVKMVAIERQSPRRLLGHVALTMYQPTAADPTEDTATHEGENALTLMRNEAELVVKNIPGGRLTIPTLRWTGVFKPVKDMDTAFAMSEPPSHDDWNPAGLAREDRLDVALALRRIGEAIQQFVDPSPVGARSADGVSAGAVSTALAGLAGSAAGGGRARNATREREQSRSTPARRKGEPVVKVLGWEPLPLTPQQRAAGRQAILVRLVPSISGSSATIAVSPGELGLGTEGASVRAPEDITLHWLGANGEPSPGEEILVSSGEELTATIEFPAGLVVDFTFRARIPS